MKLRYLVTVLMVLGIVFLALKPVQMVVAPEKRPLTATEIPFLAQPESISKSSLGPYGVLSTRRFLEDPQAAGGDALPIAEVFSFEAAQQNPLVGESLVRLEPPATTSPILRGVGAVLTDEDLVAMISVPEESRDFTLSYLVDPYLAGLTTFSLGAPPEGKVEWVDSKTDNEMRAEISTLGDISFLAGAWALRQPDLSFTVQGSNFETDLFATEVSLPTRSELVEKDFLAYDAYRAESSDELDAVLSTVEEKKYALGADLFGADGLYELSSDGGPVPTSKGLAYSFAARAIRPGSRELTFTSAGVVGRAFLQPDGDIALLLRDDSMSLRPVTVEVPQGTTLARYTFDVIPGEWNLAVLPGQVKPQ